MEKSALQAVNIFFQQIIDRKAEAIAEAYAESEELYVILEGPRLSNRGHSNIAKGWMDFCNSGLSLETIEWTEGPFSEETAEMAWVGGIIRMKVAVKGREFEQVFRASFVLIADGQQWKIKHEHVSGALQDPYGIGDWLKQEA